MNPDPKATAQPNKVKHLESELNAVKLAIADLQQANFLLLAITDAMIDKFDCAEELKERIKAKQTKPALTEPPKETP